MGRLLSLLIIFLMLNASCKINPNLQGKGVGYIQGIWNEDSIAYRNELLQYTTHHFKFTCDSFYVTMNTQSKTNIYPDSCFNNGKWAEFAKGIYTSKKDTLFLSGTFTKPNFKQKISGCYRIGTYIETFVASKKSDDFIEFKSLKQHLPLRLTLKQKITCIQQSIN